MQQKPPVATAKISQATPNIVGMKCEEVITAPADYNKELDTTTH